MFQSIRQYATKVGDLSVFTAAKRMPNGTKIFSTAIAEVHAEEVADMTEGTVGVLASPGSRVSDLRT